MRIRSLLAILILFTLCNIFYNPLGLSSKAKSLKTRQLTSKELSDFKILFPGKSISRQSFFVDFKNFRNVYFISVDDSSQGPNKCSFHLIRDKKIIYTFPKISDVESYHSEIKAVSFKDMNFDGYRDVTIILEYMTGAGPTGSVPFAASTIFFNDKKNNFFINNSVDIKIKDMDSISKIYNFVKKKFKK